jgi:cold shock protein
MYPPNDQAAVEDVGIGQMVQCHEGVWLRASDRGGKDIFVHASAPDRAGIADVDGRPACYGRVVDGRKGPEAASLRLI